MQPSHMPDDTSGERPNEPEAASWASSTYPEPTRGFGIKPDESVIASNTSGFSNQPAEPSQGLARLAADQPTPVVKVLSVRGVEYFMMTIALWLAASGLLWALLALVNGSSDYSVMVFPASFLIVCVPIFAYFYIRLRKAELIRPELRFDPSKRRLSQITQILAYLICLSNTIAFVYTIMAKISGESKASLGKAFINLLLVFLVAGGILVYYWFDEHRVLDRG